MCKSLLDPKMDYIFKQIFGNEDYVDTLISFLNALFHGKPRIKSLILKNTEITKILKENMTNRLDIRARTDNDIELDIEIQIKNTGEIKGRSLHYTANIFPQILNKNDSYEKARVIGIWILGESVTDRKDAISEAYMTFQPSQNDGYEILSENERIIYIELPKFNPKDSDKRDLLNGWLEFIKEPSLMDLEWLGNREISRAMDRLKYLSADDEVRAIADLRQKDLNDRISEKNIAIQNAIKEERAKAEKREQELKSKAEKREQELKSKADAEKRESVRNLLSAGVNAEIIAKSLGISIEEVIVVKQ